VKEIKIILPDPDDVLPEEFVKHMANAAKEVLLAFKCLIEAGIEKIEAMEESVKVAKEIKKIEIE
jgi:hypothetical protein